MAAVQGNTTGLFQEISGLNDRVAELDSKVLRVYKRLTVQLEYATVLNYVCTVHAVVSGLMLFATLVATGTPMFALMAKCTIIFSVVIGTATILAAVAASLYARKVIAENPL